MADVPEPVSPYVSDKQDPQTVPIVPEIGKQIFKLTPCTKHSRDEDLEWARKLYLEPLLEGWRREIVIRKTASDRDVYYWSPDGKKLRSRPEVSNFLADHGISKFSAVFNFSFTRKAFGGEFEPYEIIRQAGDRGRLSSVSVKQPPNKTKDLRTETSLPPSFLMLTADDFCPTNETSKKWRKRSPSRLNRKVKQEILTTPEEIVATPEETYCICNSGEDGKMILCDNRECEIGWYHFNCIRLTDDPEGFWYCPTCKGTTSDVVHPEFAKKAEL